MRLFGPRCRDSRFALASAAILSGLSPATVAAASPWLAANARAESSDAFRKAAGEAENALKNDVPLAAYEQAIKASHIFNSLQARGVISVAERQAYIGRVRDLAKGACAAWIEHMGYAK